MSNNAQELRPIQTDTVPFTEELDPAEFPKVSMNSMGAIKLNGSIENLRHLLKRHGITCRYNMITREEEIHVPGKRFTKDNAANCSVQQVINLCINNNLPRADVLGHLKLIADENAYNPVIDWITSKEWDGIDRISQVVDSIHVPDTFEEIKKIYMRKWFMCAVGMLYNGMDDVELEYEGVLVLQGKQGLGKTRWFKSLIPDHLGNMVIDGFELDLNNKDSRLTFASHWLVELGELDSTFKKSEVSALKAFITMKKDKIRRPYDRVDTTLFRRTTMFASVNDEQFLHDSTGNRRFWCLSVDAIDVVDDLDVQQLWAQAHAELEQNGGVKNRPWFVVGEEAKLRDRVNAGFSVTDPIEESIGSTFDYESSSFMYRAPSTSIAKYAGTHNPNRGHIMAAKRAALAFGGEEIKSGSRRYVTVPQPVHLDRVRMRELGFQEWISGKWVTV